MQFDKDLQLIYITEVTKKDIIGGLSDIAQGYIDKDGNFYTRNSKGQLFRKLKEGPIVFINDKEQIHREDGPAIEYTDGGKQWFINGKLHRLDGPAIERADGSKEWYVNDKLHRLDGPAIERANGGKAWFINDKRYSRPQWREKVKELQLK